MLWVGGEVVFDNVICIFHHLTGLLHGFRLATRWDIGFFLLVEKGWVSSLKRVFVALCLLAFWTFDCFNIVQLVMNNLGLRFGAQFISIGLFRMNLFLEDSINMERFSFHFSFTSILHGQKISLWVNTWRVGLVNLWDWIQPCNRCYLPFLWTRRAHCSKILSSILITAYLNT